MASPTPAPTAAAVYQDSLITFLAAVFISLGLYVGLRMVLKLADRLQHRIAKNLKVVKKILADSDEFYKRNGYTWDWCFVFKVAEDKDKPTAFQRKYSVRNVITALTEARLQTTMFYSVQHDEVYCKVRAAPERVKQEADRIAYKMLLDPLVVKSICDRGREDQGWGPVVYSTGDGTLFPTELAPFELLYAAYDKERAGQDDVPYKSYKTGQFKDLDRIKLVKSIIECSKQNGGAGMKIKDLVRRKACMGVFPLHTYTDLVVLQRKWLNLLQMPGNQPDDDIKDYYGEKIALYFVWLGHYTKWLISAAVMGFACYVATWALDSNPDNGSIPYFTVYMSLWATLYLESWKRTQAETALKWGMTEFEQEEQPRPEFDAVAELRESPVDAKPEKYFPARKQFPVLLYSVSIVSVFVIMVAGAIFACYIFRAFLSYPAPLGLVSISTGKKKDEGIALGGIIGSGLNAVQIQVMNVVYQVVAERLTDAENHRTETQYEDSLIAKTFAFQFINSYMSLIYVAFIKDPMAKQTNFEHYCYPNCMAELNVALGIIFAANIVVGNITEVLVPQFLAMRKAKKEAEQDDETGLDLVLTDAEKQFLAVEYDAMMGTFKDYAEMIIQFGYCTLFVAAFPMATVLALLNNYIEIRVDGYKLCQTCRRPIPTGAQDIGTWYAFLELMSTIAVMSNMALFALTGSQLSNWSWKERVVFFVGMEHVILGIKALIAAIIPDVPEGVEVHLKRQEFLLSKIVDNIADDVEDEPIDETVDAVDLTVKLTDFVPALDRKMAMT